MKVLLTGYSGFLGRYLAPALKEEGFIVRVLLHRSTVPRREFEKEVDELFWGAIDDRDTLCRVLEGVDAVIHSAWSFSSPSAERPTINETGTEVLFEESVQAHVQLFAFMSSVAVYGMGNREDLKESDALAAGAEANYIYPSEKIEVEEFLQLHTSGNPQVGIFRPGIIFDDTRGPVKKAFTIAGWSFAIAIGNGRNRMPCIHAKDVSTAVVRWLKNRQEREVYNVTPTNCMRQVDWYRTWCRMHGQNATPVFIPPSIVRLGAFGVKVLKNLLGKQGQGNVEYVIKSATRDSSYLNEKLKRELEWGDELTTTYTGCKY